jgi:hypothetical protein
MIVANVSEFDVQAQQDWTIENFDDTVKVGDDVDFQYIDREKVFSYPNMVKYQVDRYTGKILKVRDVVQEPLRNKTIYEHYDVERSRHLITIQLKDNKIKSFYCGRIINAKVVKTIPVKKKSFVRKAIDKLVGK